MTDFDNRHVWTPLAAMPDGAARWGNPLYRDLAERWAVIQSKLEDRERERAYLDGWLQERKRAFAIETGQIEGLYTLKSGVAEKFITEGFESARAAHTVENIADDTLKGLLTDQRDALDMVFDDIASGHPLGAFAVKSWHQLITRHQDTVVGLTPFGQRIQVPFERKGQWKVRPNNPRRPDGVVHQYCPPERVVDEMERFFDIYADIRERDYPVEVEAAWLHHRFVRTHPFQDGNGRVSRLLIAYPYLKAGLPPPVISADEKPAYIDALEAADSGELRAFSDRVGDKAQVAIRSCIRIGENALAGKLERPNGNGGYTVGDRYYPP